MGLLSEEDYPCRDVIPLQHDSDQLSRTGKEWLFGGSIRRVLNWTN